MRRRESVDSLIDARNTAASAEATLLLRFDSNVDLAGQPCLQRLAVTREMLLVYDGNGGNMLHRCWKLDDVEEFQVDATVGSCFLQARVRGSWTDVLRSSGNAGNRLGEIAWRLNHLRETGCWHDVSGRTTSPDGKPATAAVFDAEQPAPRRNRQRIMRHLLVLIRPFRAKALLLLGLSLSAVLIDIAPPMLQGVLVDRVLEVNDAAGRMRELLLMLLAIVAGLALFRLASAMVAFWKGRIASQVGTALTATLRDQLVQKLHELPLAFHDRNQVGMLMSRVAWDTESMHTLVYHMTSGFLLQALQLLGIGFMLFYLNPRLAAVTMIPMPLVLAGSWYFTRYLYPRHHHYWEAVGRQAAALTDILSGIRVVKSFVQEDREVERFRQSSGRLRDSRQTVDTSTSGFAAWMGFFFSLGGLAVWYLGGRTVLAGQMTLGSLMAFLAYLAMFYTPLTSLAEATTWLSNFLTAGDRIFSLLDTPGEKPQDQQTPLAAVRGRIEFEDVSFAYSDNRPVLRNISFRIEPGEMIGVVGRSGSGKSTLVSLIGRLYEVDTGRLLVDDVDIRQINRRQLRRRIGLVLQEPFLFRGSVAQNIAYGDPEASAEQTLLAARYADAHDFIMQMSFAYETQLGQGGSGLSGGERQRLSIARALLFDPPILILDEATASVDAESERAIRDAVARFASGRTTIVIGHHLSTLRDADRLLVFDQGRLVEHGTHEQLMAQRGVYAKLSSIQANSSLGHDSGAATPSGLPSARPTRTASREEDMQLRWLDSSHTSITDDGFGTLQLQISGEPSGPAFAVLAFPGAHPEEFIGIRRQGAPSRTAELGMIRSLADWPQTAQQAVRRSLRRRYLLRRIREIRNIRTNGNSLSLVAATDNGAERIELEKRSDGLQTFGDGGVLLLDAQGNYYAIPDLKALPAHQQRLLSLYFGN